MTSFHRRRDTIKVDRQNRNYKGWAQTLLPSLLKMSNSQRKSCGCPHNASRSKDLTLEKDKIHKDKSTTVSLAIEIVSPMVVSAVPIRLFSWIPSSLLSLLYTLED